MTKKYIVKLNDHEQQSLDTLFHKGKVAIRRLTCAHILRLAHEQHSDAEIAEVLKTSIATIERVREKFVVGGLDWALQEEPRAGAPSKLDGKQEAFLVALACSAPPTGQHNWTMQLLADRLLELSVIEQAVCDETIRRALKKTNLSRGSKVSGAFRRSVLNSSGAWKMCWISTPSRIIRAFPWSASMSVRIN